ncbi:unnamed protein product [Pylaiella littoralis]
MQAMHDESGGVSSTMPFGMDRGAFRQRQQQHLSHQPVMAYQQQQQQQQRQQQEHPPTPTPVRETYKSCVFCAKRKRKCSGDLPRCSLCIEKKQPYCHYQPKPQRAAKAAAVRRRASSSSSSTPSGGIGTTSQLGGEAYVTVHTGEDAMTVTSHRNVTMGPGSTSLKRCRLSASPATGLVGMQENAFLGDFFGCLGILPLATESIVRHAMVEIMMEAVAPRQNFQNRYPSFGNGGLAMGEEAPEGAAVGTRLAEGEEEGWGRTLFCRDVPDNPAKCMMWCAIALGALMRGSPVEFVAGYIRLARESIAECFDGNNVNNARAYLMMSFVHVIIRDEARQEKSEKYLSFAMSIVTTLGPDEVPQELKAALVAVEKMRCFHTAGTIGDGFTTYCDTLMDLPLVGDVMQQQDICNFILVADRRIRQAFIKDMHSREAFGRTEEELVHAGKGDHVAGEFLELPVGGRMAGSRQERAWGKEPQPPTCGDRRLSCSWRNGGEPPPSGNAIKGFVREALPELQRLSKTLERSDTCSGVGGLLFHGSMAYMMVVEGDLVNSFASLEACARVVVRYPGSVLLRPQLMHAVLAASRHSNRRDLYDTVKEVYNSGPPMHECSRAPPYEEFRGMYQLCDHVFCRSVQVEVHGREANQQLDATAAADKGQAVGSFFSPSPFAAGFESSRTGAEPCSSDSLLMGSGQGSQVSSVTEATVAAIDTATPAESLPSEVPPKAPHPQVLHENDTAFCRTAATGEDFQHLPHFTETDPLMSEPVTPAAGAIDDRSDVGWQNAATGRQRSALGAAFPAGDAAPNVALFEGELGFEQEEVHLTDADLVDMAAVLTGEEGLLDKVLL